MTIIITTCLSFPPCPKTNLHRVQVTTATMSQAHRSSSSNITSNSNSGSGSLCPTTILPTAQHLLCHRQYQPTGHLIIQIIRHRCRRGTIHLHPPLFFATTVYYPTPRHPIPHTAPRRRFHLLLITTTIIILLLLMIIITVNLIIQKPTKTRKMIIPC